MILAFGCDFISAKKNKLGALSTILNYNFNELFRLIMTSLKSSLKNYRILNIKSYLSNL